jgi:hypothetical protein
VRMRRVVMAMACVLAVGLASADVVDAKPKGKNCKKLCKSEIKGCRDECTDLTGRDRRDCRKACKSDILAACAANPDPDSCLSATTTTTTAAPPTTMTTSTSPSTTSTTVPYGSASRAFLDPVASLLQ